MCAIVDANVAGEVFGDVESPAGKFFFDWLNSKGTLVVGGQLTKELSRHTGFVSWLRTGLRVGRARTVDNHRLESELLRVGEACKSNDLHIIGLAETSGARLLFTNDRDLQEDFRHPAVLSGVRGRIFTTNMTNKVTRTHRDLLRRTDLCNA